MEEIGNSSYGDMLEKYRDIDEDALMADMTEEELLQLENEINREVLEAVPDAPVSDEEVVYSSSEDEEEPQTLLEKYLPAIERRKELQRQQSLMEEEDDHHEDIGNAKNTLKHVDRPQFNDRKTDSHKFEKPELKKAAERPKNPWTPKPLPNDGIDPDALKRELIESVKKREIKKRIKRANSSIDRRSSLVPGDKIEIAARKSKPKKSTGVITSVNNNFATDEMNDLRSRLKKVKVKEPKLILPDELQGVSFNRITAGVKNKNANLDDEDDTERYPNSEDGDTSRNSAYDADNDVTPSVSDGSSVVVCDDDDDKFTINKAISLCSESPSDELIMFAANLEPPEPPLDPMSDMAINSNSVEDMLERVKYNDPELVEVNLNNIQNIAKETLDELVSSLNTNTYVKSLQLANTGLTDSITSTIAKMLKTNSTVTTLNIESNFITGAGAIKVVSALRKNNTLTELRLDNQRHIFGSKIELEFAKLLKENRSLLKFSYQFSQAGPRMTAHGHLTKNMDLVRKKRLEERKKQGTKLPPKPALRRQPSSEWYRKEKADRIKALQAECKMIASEPDGAGKTQPPRVIQPPPPPRLSPPVLPPSPPSDDNFHQDKKVETMLQNMKPDEVSLLEQWFAAKLLGKTDKPPQAEHERVKAEEKKRKEKEVEKIKNQPKKLEHPRAKALKRSPSPNPVNQRAQLLDSIRNPGLKLKKVVTPTRSPYLTDASDSDSEYANIKASNKKIAEKKNQNKSANIRDNTPTLQKDKLPKTQHPVPKPPVIKTTQPSIDESTMKKIEQERKDAINRSNNSGSVSPEVREWNENEHYDSDEYEIVEVEVSDSESEESAVDEEPENVETFHVREPYRPKIMSDNDDSGMQTISDEDGDFKKERINLTTTKPRHISNDEGVSVRTPSPVVNRKPDLKLSGFNSSSPPTSYSPARSQLTPSSGGSSPVSSPRLPRSPGVRNTVSRFSGSSGGGSPRTPSSPLAQKSPLSSKYGSHSPGLSSPTSNSSRLKPSSLTYQRPGSPNVTKICPKAYSAVDSFFK